MKRRDFLKGALLTTGAGAGMIAAIKYDPHKGIALGSNVAQANAEGAEINGRCGMGMNCGGGGGECGMGMNCGGGDGQCGMGMNCSGS